MSASKVSESHQDLRLARQLGRDFDDQRLVRAGDDELVLRAAAAALARPRARRHRRRPALLLAAALLLAFGTAAAAASVWVAGRAAPRARTAEAAPPTTRSLREHAGGAPLVHAAPSLEPRASASETLEPRAAVAATAALSPPTSRRSSSASAPGPRTAASLFQEASAARRAGDLRSARVSYLELQASFADSNEARVSHVSLGKLLLGAGHAGEAERQFREYLGQGGGDLRAEALVGRAEALGALGQSAEERRAWQEILQQHPSSVYAPRARLRLGELGAAD